MNKTSILIVEDDRPIRNLIVTTLKTHEYKYLTAENGREAILEASSHNPDIILLDLGLPDMEGVDVIKKIRTWSNMPIIVISARSEDSDKIEALDAGADDYITKPFSLMVLVSKVQAFMRRMEGVCGHNRILSGNIEVNYGEMRALKRNADGVTPLTLSKKELQIMIYFMENARQILSKEQILEYVCDVDGQFVDDNTVPVNISRLKGKIGNDYIQNVRGMGYIWTEESVQE